MRVAIADDSALFRRGLALLLEAAGLTVPLSVGSGAELEAALVADPGPPDGVDVAVVDIRMPPTFTDEGLVTAEALRRSHPALGVLVLNVRGGRVRRPSAAGRRARGRLPAQGPRRRRGDPGVCYRPRRARRKRR